MRKREKIRKLVSAAPDAPGVYLMKGAGGKVLYVGKAKSLKKRLVTYFGRDPGSKTVKLMAAVQDIEMRLCANESMALLLENSLIKRFQPKYNISLRDDKSYPLVKVTNESYPAVYVTRKRSPDGSRYFGPYTSAALLRQALKIIRRHFPYRSCRKMPKEACIYYRIGLSPAPCIGRISRSEYARTIRDIALILNGKSGTLIRRLTAQMSRCARRRDYEEAARLRDQVEALSALERNEKGFSSRDELEDLRHLLGLKNIPLRIEAFDISNIHGTSATGSMVSFFHGRPDKNQYRRFRIRTVGGIDDFAMTAEVVRRRYRRVIGEGMPVPDLVLIDGGRGHLLTALKVCEELGLAVPLVSIAKEFEHIYVAARKRPIKLKDDTPALNLLRRIRDEAHRFAVAYHRVLRRKKVIGG
ncbi:MAG: excinuclease ABC subunit UvrC [Candidatus Omnitrophica bacterium]|nr:excinuclease ABC subunit UvrC [Candidatus Omnitrophota bacterium]